jgi:excisionase family DNA binding protein
VEERQKRPAVDEPRVAYSIAETARALGVGRTSVKGFIRDGKLPVVRLGRRTLVRPADLDALVAEGRPNAA